MDMDIRNRVIISRNPKRRLLTQDSLDVYHYTNHNKEKTKDSKNSVIFYQTHFRMRKSISFNNDENNNNIDEISTTKSIVKMDERAIETDITIEKPQSVNSTDMEVVSSTSYKATEATQLEEVEKESEEDDHIEVCLLGQEMSR